MSNPYPYFGAFAYALRSSVNLVEMRWKDDMLDDGSGGGRSCSCCGSCLKKLKNRLSQDDIEGADIVV